jgi:hypothetical protein
VDVDTNLPQQTRFNKLSDTIVGRIDDMGSKIDELEKALNDVMAQAGVESKPTSSDTTKRDSKGSGNINNK